MDSFDLISMEGVTASQVFGGGLEDLLSSIEQKARSVATDISTEKGRKEIASLAYKIAKSKTALDKLGSDLVAEWKRQAKVVDAERAKAWDRLDRLQKEIRKPLTAWEESEKARVAKFEAKISTLENIAGMAHRDWKTASVASMRSILGEISEEVVDWAEFSSRGDRARKNAVSALTDALALRTEYDYQQAELDRLKRAEADRIQRERDEKIAAEAAEKAKKEAEEEARKEIERERIEAERKAAEAERKAAEAAAKAERERIENERLAEARKVAEREANREHKNRVLNLAVSAFLEKKIPEEFARQVVDLIDSGFIPGIKIQY
jgi:hypothetical protein